MPRHKDKTPCKMPGCHNWAMRGYTRCRAHRDAELGPRSVGAPRGNLNALKTGRHAHPLDQPDLHRLARRLVDEPELLPYHLGLAAQSLQSRTRDPHQTLHAFRTTLAGLQPLVAHYQLATELRDLLRQFSLPDRERVRQLVLDQLPPDDPERQLHTFHGLVAEVDRLRKHLHRPSPPEDGPFCFPKNTQKQVPEPGSQSPIPDPQG
jgi:hypothetical protein